MQYKTCFPAVNAEVAKRDIFATRNPLKSRGRPRLISPISKLRHRSIIREFRRPTSDQTGQPNPSARCITFARVRARDWSSEIDSFIAAARHIRGPSSGSTIGGNGVTTEISDQPSAQPSDRTSRCDPAVLALQRVLTAVSTLLRNRPFALISV
jgi:hypothetical protein